MLLIKSFSYLYRIWFSAKITFAGTYRFMFLLILTDINFLFVEWESVEWELIENKKGTE